MLAITNFRKIGVLKVIAMSDMKLLKHCPIIENNVLKFCIIVGFMVVLSERLMIFHARRVLYQLQEQQLLGATIHSISSQVWTMEAAEVAIFSNSFS